MSSLLRSTVFHVNQILALHHCLPSLQFTTTTHPLFSRAAAASIEPPPSRTSGARRRSTRGHCRRHCDALDRDRHRRRRETRGFFSSFYFARDRPLLPAPTSRPRKLPSPLEPPAAAPIATRSVAGLRCILNVSHSSSRMNHTKSGIHTASPAVAPPTAIEAAAAQSVRSSTRRRRFFSLLFFSALILDCDVEKLCDSDDHSVLL
ncbi:hypothetical protein DEO72_LG11g1511 [Vigna unguiculata]|uniref:Uncharacterized protein n=1 Tax=Vigna unguiculata TaxID=3917 RepID=A0A4D6NL49_VIGUN|nr:hypothetical protein DEO72_LG11g1511 [Vigna unguiculata]